MSDIPVLLFVDEQKQNESLTDYVNRIAFHNGFEDSESMINVFLDSKPFKEKFSSLQKEIKSDSLPSYGLVNSEQDDLRRKRFSFKKRSFNWEDLKLFIELVTGKKVRSNSYPKKDYSSSRFKLSGRNSPLISKVCMQCWLEDPFVRFFWNFDNYNSCHHHKCSMVYYDIEKAAVSEEHKVKKNSYFFERLFAWLEENRGSNLSFNFIEKEIYQFEQDLLLAQFIAEFFKLVFSISLNYEATENLLRGCDLVNKPPDERINTIVSTLSSGDLEIESKVWNLFTLLFFIDSGDYIEYYQVCYLAKLFSFAKSVNISYYHEYVWQVIFKSELFSGLVYFVRQHHSKIFEVDCYEFDDGLNIESFCELKPFYLEHEDIDFLFSLECFKNFSISASNFNDVFLEEKSPKAEVKTDFFWFKPLREEKRLLERVLIKIMERMVANIYIKATGDKIYLPEKLHMRNY